MAGGLVAAIALLKPDPLRLRSRRVPQPATDG
jgi:hypothetical protein